MIRHSFKIKQKINNYNYYAQIELEIVENNLKPYETIIEYDDDIDFNWRFAIEFGVKYFHQHLLAVEYKSLKVKILNFHSMPGDNTPTITFYITVKCLSELLNYKKELVRIDLENGNFIVVR